MRQGLKRLIAMLMLICTLASFIVPATFADSGDQETVAQEFDFVLYDTADPKSTNAMFGSATDTKKLASSNCSCGCGKKFKEHLAELYDDLGWMILEHNLASEDNIAFRENGGYGIRAKAKGYWVAIKLKVAAPGTYTVKYTSSYAGDQKVEASVFSADLLEGSSVADQLAAATALGQISVGSADGSAEFANTWTVPSAGEYVIVFEVLSTNMFLGKLQLMTEGGSVQETTAATTATTAGTTAAPTTEESQITTAPTQSGEIDTTTPGAVVKYYDFKLPAEVMGTRINMGFSNNCSCGCGKKLGAHLADNYASLGWSFLETSLEGMSTTFVKARENGLRVRDEATKNGAVAFKLSVPAAGEFDLRYTSTYGYTGTYEAYMQTMDAYTNDQAGDKVGSVAINGEKLTGIFGSYTFPAAGEYVITLKLVNTQDMYLGALELVVPDGSAPEETIPTTTPTEPLPTECTGTYTEGFYNLSLFEEEARKWMFTENGKLVYKDLTKECMICGNKLLDCIAAQYAENELNWKVEQTTFASVGFMASDYAENGYGGLRLRYEYGEDGKILKGEDGKEVEQPGNWVALRIKVANAGIQRITVNKDNPISGCTADLYVFPAAADTMTKAQLEEKLTSENLVGQAVFDRVVTESRVGEYNFETAGEYIVVLKTADTSKRLYIRSIEIEVPAPDPDIPVTEKKVYDFDLSREDPLLTGLGAGSRYNNDRNYRVRAYMQDRYAAGTTDWKFETISTEFGATGGSFREGCFRFKNNDGYQNVPGSWYSFRIKNPGTATYDIRLVSSGNSKLVTDIYLIPAPNALTLTEEEIENAMTAENLLVSNAELVGEETFYLGEYTFGKNEEYVLVFDLNRGTLLHIQEIQMTVDGLVADGTIPKRKVINGTVYDFDLADGMYGIFTDKTVYLQDKLDTLEAMYKNGSVNWMWYNSCDELKGDTADTIDIVGRTTRFYRNTGMRFYGLQDYWTAFKIKSPGSGTFTLSLDHAVYAYSGTLAFYVLPGDTAPEDVYKTMDSSNRVGEASLFAESSTLKDGSTTYIGHWDFEAGKEYIIVFECYTTSPYNSKYCYANYSQLNMERGEVAYEKEEDKTVQPITVVEKALKVADFRGRAAIKNIGGHDYYIMPCEGGNTLVYDLDTGELADSFDGGFGLPSDVYEDSEGMIWLCGSGKWLQKYDPYTQMTETYNWAAFDLWHIEGAYDMVEYDNKIYFGSNHGGYLVCFDKETRIFREVCQLIDGNGDAVRALMLLNGYMYMAVSSDLGIHVIKFDPVTEEVVATTNIKDVQGKASSIGRLNVMGDGEVLIAGTYGGLNFDTCVAFNSETLERIEVDVPAPVMSGVTEIIDGKQYLAVVNGFGLWQYDVQTKEYSRVPGMPSGGIGFVTRTTLIDLDGKEYLFTASTGAGGNPRLYDLENKEYTSWDNLVKHGNGGTRLLSISVGEEGDNGLYIGGFNTSDCVVYDTEKGEVTATYVTGGQGDSSIWYNGKLYYGNYSSTTLNEIYPYTGDMNKDPRDNEVIQRWQLNHEETGQKRVLELAAGDGYIFAGTVPDTDQWGGSITVYNTTNGQWYTHRNIVQDHSITGLAHSGKLVWASSAFTPGTGTTTTMEQKENAHIVAYDYETREVVARFDPADYIKGLATPVYYIAGIEADPVIENRIWASVSEMIFCFDYDPDTKEFKVQEIVTYEKDTYTNQSGRVRASHDFLFDTERGYIYFGFNSGYGFQRIEIEDFSAPIGKLKVKSVKRLMGDLTGDYVIAHNGDFYYIPQGGTDLKLLPLNVTDEDWAISGAVDQMIASLGEITLEKEAAIKEARSAYENLSWRYKALVKELDTLRECEVDLLECKIDQAVAQEITADSVEPLTVFVDEYKTLLPRYQNYVKNYDALMTAYGEATALNDARVAKALQERIDALEGKFSMTLELEPEVVAIRTDYDACTPSQRILIDITLLEKAEAEIKVLRADFVKYVETLIQAIPAEITLDAEPAITVAREAADKLYMTERKDVSYSKLTSAEGKLRVLQKANAAAEEVDALISEIGIVTLGDKERIAEAREAYDALNDTALQFVTKAGKLKTAEFILKALQTWGIPAITIVNAALVVALVPSLRKKIFKSKKKEEEIMDN